MLSFRSPVLPEVVFDTWTVLPNTTFTSHCVLVMVIEPLARLVTVPRATALVPGDGEGAPGLGQTAPNPRPPPPPPPPPPNPVPPPVRVAPGVLLPAVLALTLFCPIL